ncbi:DinB family protein [Xanthomonas sp. 3498]|uniref:DinB family protein n=1 Tax=Xanthomonas sp. 3498 TaxID=2663863 RepID=UPI00160BA74E|nr:DinB family protein [Xanthomonas sp. 3498]MBB5874739.1 putative damage-inducible protein DinB [Xanthomonas sp. 3498]
MTDSLLASQFAFKAWANVELLQALAQIDGDAFPAQRERAIRLLNHTYVVDRIFAAHLQCGTHAFTASNTPQTPELVALGAAVTESDRWYADYVARLDAAALQQTLAFRFTDGDAGSMSRQEMLFHVLAHGAFHRGNIAMLLTECDVEQPRELFTRFLHAQQPQRRAGGGA